MEEKSTTDDRQSTTGGAGTVLVIEDEALLLNIIQKMLVTKGYEVLTAATPEEGLDLFSRHHRSLTVVLMDFRLPGTTGGLLFEHMREVKPDVKVVIMTGFIEPEERAALVSAGVMGILIKPFLMTDLLQAVGNASPKGEDPSPLMEQT